MEWWNSISLRTKITGVTVLLLTFGLIVTGVGTLSVMRNYLFDEVDSQVTEAAQSLPSTFVVDTIGEDGSGLPNTYLVAAVNADGRVVESNSTWQDADIVPDVSHVTLEWAVSHSDTIFTIRNTDRTSEWRGVAIPIQRRDSAENYVLVLLLPLDTTNKAIARMFTLFMLFGIVVVVLGAVLTRLLVTSTFAPLREVEKTAAAIADGDFGQRLGGATPNTEVGRLNRSLNTMLNRIDRAFSDRARTIEQMRRFVGDASHELRTPLVSVRGYAELYRMGALQSPEDVTQAMDRIEKEAVRMGLLVQDLLELARLDETKPLQLAPVDLLPLAKDAALDAMASNPGRVVSVVTGHLSNPPTGPISTLPIGSLDMSLFEEMADEPAKSGRSSQVTGQIALAVSRFRRRARTGTGLPVVVVSEDLAPELAADTSVPIISGEENKIRQVLTNLLGNATRFTPVDTPIEIVVRSDASEGMATIKVVDHGEGIPPQVREKIFQRFWRADSSRARDTGGSGLGLAIVSAIVAAHRGSVTVEETPGGGATFRVKLPLLNSQQSDEVIPNAK